MATSSFGTQNQELAKVMEIKEKAERSTLEEDLARVSSLGVVPSILSVLTEATGLRVALVSRMTDETWAAGAVRDTMGFGLEAGGELDLDKTLCREVRISGRPVVFDHASVDPVYSQHPVPAMYGIESYISVPIQRPDGEFFGTLCAFDSEPRRVSDPKTVRLFTVVADLLAEQLLFERHREHEQEALRRERETAKLREQFIAVLGHDLRNPLSSMIYGMEIMARRGLEEVNLPILGRMQESARTMAKLIDDMLDFARGRLGGGIPTRRQLVPEVEDLVRGVVDEARLAHPGQELRLAVHGGGLAAIDPGRFRQLLTNLVGNAVDHSCAESPVDVLVDGDPEHLRVAVTNRGKPIDPDMLPRLFQPYCRGDDDLNRSGLGLGLYIASEIAAAHGGRIDVTSTAETGTIFTAVLPRFGEESPAPTLFSGAEPPRP